MVDVHTTQSGRGRARGDGHTRPRTGAAPEPTPHRTTSRRSAAVAVAAAAVCVAALSLALAHAAYAARVARQEARAPVLLGADRLGSASALWHSGFDTVGGRRVSVVAIEPLTTGAPLPPGVSRWPAPGEAVLSPALVEVGAPEGVEARYGRAVGRIGRAGLSDAGEKLVYLRPRNAAGAAPVMHAISGYGSGAEAAIGEASTDRPEGTFLLLLAGFLGLPALALLVVAARQPRRGQPAAEGSPGPSVRHRVRDDAAAIGLGATAALAVLLVTVTVDVELPLVGEATAAADIAAMPALLAGAWAAGALVAFAAVAVVRPATHGRTRSRTASRPWLARTALLCPVLLLVAVRGPGLFASDSAARTTTYYVGVVGTLATLPAVLRLLTGRLTGNHRPVVTVAVALVAAIAAITQAQLWFGAPGAPAEGARAVSRVLGDSVLAVDADGAGPAELSQYVAALPTAAHPLRLVAEGRTMRVVGSCPALTAVGLACSPGPTDVPRPNADARLDALLAWYASDAERVTSVAGDAAAQPPGASALLVITADGSALRPADLAAQAYRALPLGARVHPVGQEWLTGARQDLDLARWILLVALGGLLLVGAAGGVHILRATSSAGTAGLTVAAGGALGVVLAAWLTTPLGGPGSLPAETWPALLVTTIVSGALVRAGRRVRG